MCGLFGVLGNGFSMGALRTLTLANAERGNEALGFFDNRGEIWKDAESPVSCLMGSELNAYLSSAADCWFVAGHTRNSTRGANIKNNAHPFKYGKIIGSHNGIVSCPVKYTVDSEYLIDSLHEANNDYQKALAGISGYWGLTWTDGEAFYMQAHSNSLAIAQVGDIYYYSSDWKHLRAALGTVPYHAFTEGETLRVTLKDGKVDFEALPDLVNEAKSVAYDARTSGGYGYNSSCSTGSTDTTTSTSGQPYAGYDPDAEYAALMGLKDAGAGVTDYDDVWREAWAEYLAEQAAAA